MLDLKRSSMFGRDEKSKGKIHSFTKRFVTLELQDGSRVRFHRGDGYEVGKKTFAWKIVDLDNLDQLTGN